MPSVFIFDAYGTLFNVHAAVQKMGEKIGADAQSFSNLWRAKQLEYTWTRTLMDAESFDFWQLTKDALDFCFSAMPHVPPELRAGLLDAYRQLDAYPEVHSTLQALRGKDIRMGILSNGSHEMLDAAVQSAGIGAYLDHVISVQDIAIYKPRMEVYDLVTTKFKIFPSDVSFQSSNRWDIAGAKKAGFQTVWINRAGAPDEYGDLAPDMVVGALDDLLATV